MGFKNKKLFLDKKVSLLLMLFGAVCLTLLMFYLQGKPFSYYVAGTRIKVFLLNFLPVLVLSILLFFASGRLSVTWSVSGFIVIAMSVVNRYKIVLRQDPFIPSDFYLATELFSIMGSLQKNMLLFAVLGVFSFGVAIFLLIFLLKNELFDKKIRITVSISVLLCAMLLNRTLYQNQAVNESLQVNGNPYFLVNEYQSKGFLYCFIYDFNTKKIKAPEGYSKEAVQVMAQEYAAADTEPAIKPHIIVIMGEAYSDLSENPHFDFSSFTDPLTHYKEIREESIHGRLIVPYIGGGTADTEFDVLTGALTQHFKDAPYSYRLIHKPMESLASYFKEIGYDTVAIHPGYPWFYNRQNAYEYLGFDVFYDIDDFNEGDTKGGYINETVTIDKVMDVLDSSIENNLPLFLFCVTIQNHGLYTNKYAATQNFDTDVELTDAHINELSNYFLGLTDVDMELYRLYQHLNELDEPVVLVYFGDHLPGFSQSLYETFPFPYDEEGSFEEQTFKYQVPYMIWQNEKAKGQIPFIYEEASYQPIISSNYLGAYLLELLDFKPSPFFSYVLEAKKVLPVIMASQYLDREGVFKTELKEAEKELLETYQQWEYYQIFDS